MPSFCNNQFLIFAKHFTQPQVFNCKSQETETVIFYFEILAEQDACNSEEPVLQHCREKHRKSCHLLMQFPVHLYTTGTVSIIDMLFPTKDY